MMWGVQTPYFRKTRYGWSPAYVCSARQHLNYNDRLCVPRTALAAELWGFSV